MRGFMMILAMSTGFGVQRFPLRAARIDVFNLPVDAGTAVLALALDDFRQLAHKAANPNRAAGAKLKGVTEG